MDLSRLILYFGFFINCFGQIKCSVSCQFDCGLCGWRAQGTSMYSWRTNSGQTMDRTSGPMNDVTCKNLNGKYAYLPGSFSKRGEEALLESELVDLKKQTDFSFWISMKGVGIGSMEVLLSFMNGTNVTIWSRQGEQDTGWQREHVKIGPGIFKIWFKGSVNLPYGSDMAIDDVMLKSENMVFNTSHCLTATRRPIVPTIDTTAEVSTSKSNTVKHDQTTTTMKTTQPGLTMASGDISSCRAGSALNPALLGSCDFENGLCNLTVRANMEDHDVVWKISDRRDPYYFTAPIRWDHTYKNGSRHGHYLNFQNKVWLKFAKNPYGKNASVETPVLTSTSVCLSFWYIMPTKEANLLVYIKDVDNIVKDLWQSNDVTPEWSNTVLPVKHGKPFKIVFQSRNKNYNAKIGLDDILITREAGPSTTSLYAPSKTLNTPTESPGTGTTNRGSSTTVGAYSSNLTTNEQTSTPYKTTLLGSIRVPTASKLTPQQITVSSAGQSTNNIYIGHSTPETIKTVSDKNKNHETTKLSTFSTSDYVLYQTREIPRTDLFNSSSMSVEQKTLTTRSHYHIKSTTVKYKNTKKPSQTTKRAKSSMINTAEQSGHRFRNSSTVIGYSVGGLVFVTVIAVAIYFVHQYVRNKRQSIRQKTSLKRHHHKSVKDNGGFFDMSQTSAVGKTVLPTDIEQNGVLNSETYITNGKLNGHSVRDAVIDENGHNTVPPKHSESLNEIERTNL